MPDLTIATVARALDGLDARAFATAHNVANLGSPGFLPVRVSFERSLQQALMMAEPSKVRAAPIDAARELPATVGGLRPDLELSLASDTASRFAVLTALADRQFQLHSLALKGVL